MGEKIDIGANGFVYPMPVTLIGADIESGPNFMAIAWVNRAESRPPLVMCALGKVHATNEGIRRHGEFSVNIPSVEQMRVVDWCGMASARRGADKASPFTVHRGKLEHAPLISECPLGLECRVERIVDIGTHELVVGEIVATWTEERYLDDSGNPDVVKLRPFTLTMPDNRYWTVGEQVGRAWSAGSALMSEQGAGRDR